MPYCPKCDMEFVEGITVCSDCGGPLVESEEEARRIQAQQKAQEAQAQQKAWEAEALADPQEAEADPKRGARPAAPRVRGSVDKAQKYDDLKSSASAFLLIGGLLLAVSVLCWTGILHIPMARVSRLLFQGVLTCMGCFAIGVYIRTSRSAKELLPQIRQEKDQTDAILEWFQETYDRQAIDSRIEDAGQLSDEELALKRFQIIQDFLVTGRDLPDPSYVDALSEELYGRLFES